MRCSTPGKPLGILEKSPAPSSFCSLKQNGQWSVETTERSSVRNPRHRLAWCSRSRSGGEQTYFAPSKPSRARSSAERNKYCGQVSAKAFWPSLRAWATASRAPVVERWTM